MIINIKPVDTKGRDIISFEHEYIELGDTYFRHNGKMVTEEWEQAEDGNDIDNLIKEAQTAKLQRERSWHIKIKKSVISGVEKLMSYENNAWEVRVFIMEDYESVSFESEEEADEVFGFIDKWLFTD